MQIIYISTTGEKYLRFNFQNMKARKVFACCNLAARCLHTEKKSSARLPLPPISYYLKRHERKKAPTVQLLVSWS